MSGSIGVAVRRRRSHTEVERLVQELEQSGLTRQAFCAEHGLSVSNLDNYRRRRRRRGSESAAKSWIVPVELVGRVSGVESRGALRVELANGRRIEVASGFDAPTLERLAATLEKA
jgi:transposase-like protein